MKVMTRDEILNEIKGLDESNVFPYLYDVLTDGSSNSERWIEELEDANIKSTSELCGKLNDMFAFAR